MVDLAFGHGALSGIGQIEIQLPGHEAFVNWLPCTLSYILIDGILEMTLRLGFSPGVTLKA